MLKQLADLLFHRGGMPVSLDIGSRPFNQPLVDAPKIFGEFELKKLVPTRNQFETEEEFAKRCPKTIIDPEQVVYFGLPNAHDDGYQYDLQTKKLTVYGGRIDKYADPGKAKVAIMDKYDFNEPLQYKNRQGATYEVTRENGLHYRLRLDEKFRHILPLIGEHKGLDYFRISVLMEREMAKEHAKDLSLVLGVRLIAWDRYDSFHYTEHDEDISWDRSHKNSWEYRTIDANFASLHLVHPKSGTQLAAYTRR